MPYPLDVLINEFAIRSFRDTADRDYANARLAYRAQLFQQSQWSALHCLEKYIKTILLLNRVDARNLRHEVTKGITLIKEQGNSEIEISDVVSGFLHKLEDGAHHRYFEVSYDAETCDLMRLDRAVWEIRRYCQPLAEVHAGPVQPTLYTPQQLVAAKTEKPKSTCINNGWLEKVLLQRSHPARPGLIWKNLYFGNSNRKSVKIKSHWEFGNAFIWNHPEIMEEINKYCRFPKGLAEAYSQLAKKNLSI